MSAARRAPERTRSLNLIRNKKRRRSRRRFSCLGLASPGTPLLRLEDTREFRLNVRVDESLGGRIQNGDRIPVVLGNDDEPVSGTVAEVSRSVDSDARAFLVKIALPVARGVRSGEFEKAQFRGVARRALFVPSGAVMRS